MMSQAIAATKAQASSPPTALALLTFRVAGQVYGLPVTDVARIIEMVTITQLPDSPEMIQGIINLQGKAVPVMDLRHRFGLPHKAYGLHTPIILADVEYDSGHHDGGHHDGGHQDGRMLGLIVDAVEDVIEIPAEDLETTEAIVPTDLAGQMNTRAGHLASIAKIDRQMILVLNVRALLSPTEQMKLLQALGSELTNTDGRQ
ncbi:MAG: chemotaxis protein CheW [Anaerolineae bacterium]|nr:chemotaxis protein CheW [Anaerolineae bacterium]